MPHYSKMAKCRNVLALCTAAFLSVGVLFPLANAADRRPEISCIVLGIADGTSQEMITATRFWKAGAEGRLALEAFPAIAIVKTHSASDLVTDSAAAATAIARGIKAANGMIGQANAEASVVPPSLLDVARAAGWLTAVVTDDSVTGATPAPFVIEHPNRNNHAIIASKMIPQLGKRVDLLLGGGSQWFAKLSQTQGMKPCADEVVETVEANGALLRSSGVRHFDSWQAFLDGTRDGLDGHPVLGTFAPDVLSYHADGARNFRLVDMVERAVRLLEETGKPFLLVFEAALPDKAAHLNNAKRALNEVAEFDATLDWLSKHLGSSALILATTDHNNGGFTMNGPPLPRSCRGDVIFGINPVTDWSIITWASGPGADRNSSKAALAANDPQYVQPALVPLASSLHSGGDVWLLADGPGSEAVHGYMDNTHIHHLIADAIRARPIQGKANPPAAKSVKPPLPRGPDPDREEEEEIRAWHKPAGAPAAAHGTTSLFVGQEVPVPLDYAPPRVMAEPGGGVVVQPVTPKSFEVRKTGFGIDTRGVFKQTELQGFIDYGSPIRMVVPVQNEKGDTVGSKLQVFPNPVLQPVFQTIQKSE